MTGSDKAEKALTNLDELQGSCERKPQSELKSDWYRFWPALLEQKSIHFSARENNNCGSHFVLFQETVALETFSQLTILFTFSEIIFLKKFDSFVVEDVAKNCSVRSTVQ